MLFRKGRVAVVKITNQETVKRDCLMSGKLNYLLLIMIVILIAIFIRVIPLDSESLTGDELYSLEVAKDLFGSGLKQVGYNLAHPPLYYVFLYPIVNYIGEEPVYLRLISLVAGIIIILSVIVWTSRLTGKSYAGILGGLLVAISSLQIYYSQDAEGYSLYSLLIFFAAISLYSALERNNIKYWILYSLFMALSFLTHYISVIYFLLFGLYIVSLRNYRHLKKWILLSLPAIILLATWFIYLWRSYTAEVGAVEQLSWIDKPDLFSLFYLFAGFNGLPPFNKGATITLLALLILISLCATRLVTGKAWKNDPKLFGNYILIGSFAFLPPVILFIAALPPLSMKVWVPRHVFPSQAFLIVFIAMSIWYLFNKNKKLLIFSIIVMVGMQTLGSIGWTQGPKRHPYREIAQYTCDINTNNVPVYTTYYRCPGRVCNYYLNDKEYVKNAPDDLSYLPSEFILIYRPAVTEDGVYYTNLTKGGWQKKNSLHFGSKWGHTVAKMESKKGGSVR